MPKPPPGTRYDEESQTLTIETWAPGWADLHLDLVVSEGSVVALIAAHEGGVRREHGLRVGRLIIERAQGGPSSAQ